MSKALIYTGLAVAVGYYLMKAKDKPPLEFFSPLEFDIWYPFMDNKLLFGLDELRRRWGHPIKLSTAVGALGRNEGNESSWHFPRNGIVHAADVMPTKNGRGLNDKELGEIFDIARNMQVFGGIGVYPDWKPNKGLHLDTRTDRDPVFDPALWGGIKDVNGNQEYVSVSEALRA